MCCAGGDRTRHHNLLQNQIFQSASLAIPGAEMEKSGLLLPSRPGTLSNALRRPADIYLPSWNDGRPAALDLAITAPQRQDIVAEAAISGLAAARAYSDTKRSHLNTALECEAAGVNFIPLVAETTGAWSTEALTVLKALARAAAQRQGLDTAGVTHLLLQRTSIAIRRANARTHLSRLARATSVGLTSAQLELTAET